MQIIPNHNKISKPVEAWEQICYRAEEMLKLTQGEFKHGQTAYALHHSQVSKEPLNFFTVHDKLVKMGILPAIVINPEILSADQNAENFVRTEEGCLSFPYRAPKKLDRLFTISVRYQLAETMETKEEQLSGLPAQIFQHEVDHAKGINIFGMVRE